MVYRALCRISALDKRATGAVVRPPRDNDPDATPESFLFLGDALSIIEGAPCVQPCIARRLARVTGPDGNAVLKAARSPIYEPTTNSIYYVDGYAVWRLDADNVATMVAGSMDLPGCADGPAAAASFSSIAALTVDGLGSIYVADGSLIRKLALPAAGAGCVVSTLQLSAPEGPDTDDYYHRAGRERRGWTALSYSSTEGALYAATATAVYRVCLPSEQLGEGAEATASASAAVEAGLEAEAAGSGRRAALHRVAAHTLQGPPSKHQGGGRGSPARFPSISAMLACADGRLYMVDRDMVRQLDLRTEEVRTLAHDLPDPHPRGCTHMAQLPSGWMVLSGDASSDLKMKLVLPGLEASLSSGADTTAVEVVPDGHLPVGGASVAMAAAAVQLARLHMDTAAAAGEGRSAVTSDGGSSHGGSDVSALRDGSSGGGSAGSSSSSSGGASTGDSGSGRQPVGRLDGSSGGDAEVTLLAAGEAFRTRRSLLTEHSGYFRQLLEPGGARAGLSAGATTTEVELPGADPAALAVLLRYMGGGKLRLSPELLRPTAELAERLALHADVRALLQLHVLRGCTPPRVVEHMLWAQGHGMMVLMAELMQFFRDHFRTALHEAPEQADMLQKHSPRLLVDALYKIYDR